MARKKQDDGFIFFTNRWHSLHTIFCGLSLLTLYIWTDSYLFTDGKQLIYSGAGSVTATALFLCSLVLITTFYTMTFVNRHELAEFYNSLRNAYQDYTTFYTGRFRTVALTLDDLDSEKELHFVFLRLFFKAVLINGLNIGCSLGVAVRLNVVAGVNIYHFSCLLIVPYMVKSVTSSFLYLGSARISFLFYKIHKRLMALRDELHEFTTSKTHKSAYEKMSKFCELSDEVDKLSRCFERINGSGKEITSFYKFQIILVLSYSVINTLHEMFTQYQIISSAVHDKDPLDVPLLLYSIFYTTLNIIEILLVVSITDSCHIGSARMGKTVQSLMFYHEMDNRLKQSVGEDKNNYCSYLRVFN